jgi:glyoxylase-like metal-dependent hydrolase (beta-lactamase superfamily II)/rhodanese-related sulfurtransferase
MSKALNFVVLWVVFSLGFGFMPVFADAKKNADVIDINTVELQALIKDTPNLVLIDVRTPKEVGYLGGFIDHPNEVNIPRGWLEFRVGDAVPDFDTPIVVYCGTNIRSPLAAATLQKLGYTRVKNYQSGFVDWKSAKLPVKSPDEAPGSMLYRRPVKVIDGVYSAIGETGPPTYENSGHNNNLSFIVTNEGVLVVNAGDNYLLAKALHAEIKKITDKPVKYVVLENGQGHAMLGSNYWKEQGVPIIAHIETVHEIEEAADSLLQRMKAGRRDKALGSRVVMPDRTFDEKMEIKLGGLTIQLLHPGPAHSPGDIMVWLPEKSLVITGDMAFHERMLPVFEHTDTAAWLDTWEKFAALNAKYVIPGHGHATNMEEVTQYTKGYLTYMREQIAKIIEDGGDLQEAYEIDQSAYAHLDTYKILAKQNAGRIFRAMEFE